ncbi:holo-ACP synthase [Helicobacter kayseriensis]|uniref:holo-ACP synthase n=1 Tax=Helicobacter kayseriensis TaxID=2905877 RepID=UPI001E2F55CE|nr:holo-ACP synthase [Helicobacter kayseriensis]MCE3049081.1 holo-ACP synthase [Helicobacter kayseriensis]
MIGIDIISIDRIQKVCDRFGSKFLSRFLSQQEIQLCLKDTQELNYQRIAGFWAAKEAISKAIGTGIGEDLLFLDILLSKDSKGKPQATLLPHKMQAFHLKELAISITHDQNLAIAIAWIRQN